jgi:hypothetical protein
MFSRSPQRAGTFYPYRNLLLQPTVQLGVSVLIGVFGNRFLKECLEEASHDA